MNGAIAIFVKTPGRSTVKGRLTDGMGARYAVDWYLLAAAAVASVARVAQARHSVDVYWAVAEPDAMEAWPGLPVIPQGDGGLGARMARVHAELATRHGFGVLLGADAPQLTADLLGDAIDWLSAPAPRLVLGPARDGGFWLYGSNVVPALDAWTSVRYSSDDTARAFRQSMRGIGEWMTLATLTDVDRAGDLRGVEQALDALRDPTREQSALGIWMRGQDGPTSMRATQ